LAGAGFFLAAGFGFFGAGLRSGFLGLENLTGFFFDLVAIADFGRRSFAPVEIRTPRPGADSVSATR
jgi:hypothetical protein